jgi:hypothetical protein
MREFLTEIERNYIKEKITEPMRPDVSKSVVFGSIPRAQLMLESSLKRLSFDKQYEARVFFEKMNERQYLIRVQGKRKDCNEIVSLDYPVTLT